MWGNNGGQMNNNNGSDINVNTSLRTSNSEQSSMVYSLWNQYVSIKISYAIGVDANGVTQYDKTRKGQTALSGDACQALFERFKNEIYPVYEGIVAGDGSAQCPMEGLSVTTETGKEGKRNIVGISMRPSVVPDDPVPDMFFVIYSMVDSQNIAVDANIFEHRFPKRIIRLNYNPKTGLCDSEVKTNADFNIFLNILGRTELLLPFSEHVRKYTQERDRMFSSRNNNQQGGYSQNQPSYGAAANGAYGAPSYQQPNNGGGFGMNIPNDLPFS